MPKILRLFFAKLIQIILLAPLVLSFVFPQAIARAEEVTTLETDSEQGQTVIPPETSPELAHKLVISAIQTSGGPGKTTEDYIELFNPTAEAINLKEFVVVKRTATAQTDTILVDWDVDTWLEPMHFYLWANSGLVSLNPDKVSSGTLADNNSIAIRWGGKDVGTILDILTWGDVDNGFVGTDNQNIPASQALVRVDVTDVSSSEFELATNRTPKNSTQLYVEQLVDNDTESDEPNSAEELSDTTHTDNADTTNADSQTEPGTGVDTNADTEVSESTSSPTNTAKKLLKITEVLPNPTGADAGQEQVELYNTGETTVSLSGLILDDVVSEQALSTNALTLKPDNLTQTELLPDSFVKIVIPAGSFSLNNANGDVVTLFDEDRSILDSVFYQANAGENLSYSIYDGVWSWGEPTLGQENHAPKIESIEDNSQDSEETNQVTETTTKKLSVATTKQIDNKTTNVTKTTQSPKKTNITKVPAKTPAPKTVKTSTSKSKSAIAKQSTLKKTADKSSAKEKTTKTEKTISTDITKEGKHQNGGVGKAVATGIAVITAGMVAMYKLVFTTMIK